MEKERIDKLLVNKGLVSSRERALILIIEGKVIVSGKKVLKAGTKVKLDEEIAIVGDDIKWVSKGGEKLEKALRAWNIVPSGWKCLDVGASTGGFADVLLTYGAEKVYALDVGHNQLAEKIKSNPKLINLEGLNARDLNDSLIAEEVDLICIDVSFISLELIIPVTIKFLKQKGKMLLLIKPQFEVGPGKVNKKGIIKDKKLHEYSIEKIRLLCNKLNLHEIGTIEAPAIGKNKNKEFLMYLIKQ